MALLSIYYLYYIAISTIEIKILNGVLTLCMDHKCQIVEPMLVKNN